MLLSRKVGLVTAAVHLVALFYVAQYIARNTARDPELPMAWLIIDLIDLPVAWLMSLVSSEWLLHLPDVRWIADATGLWITGKWEPFLAPLILFSTLGTVWWFLVGWGAGSIWTLVRSRT